MGLVRHCVAAFSRQKYGLILILGTLCCAARHCKAQRSDFVQHVEGSLRVNVTLVQLDVEVFDKKTGVAAEGLLKEDFLVEEDGRAEHIAGVSRDQAPLSIVLLMDQTDTVRPVLATLATGALQALEHLKPQDEIAVLAYASKTELMQTFTLSHDLAAVAIQRASRGVDHSKAFYNEAIYDSSLLLEKTATPENRKVIIWFTDNVPNVPNAQVHTEQEALQEVYSAGAVIMAIVERSGLSDVFSVINKNPIAVALHRKKPAGDVSRYVDRTGGNVIKADKTDVSARLADAVDRLRTRYRVSYYSAAKEPERRFRHVKLSVQHDGHTRSDVMVRAPVGYYR